MEPTLRLKLPSRLRLEGQPILIRSRHDRAAAGGPMRLQRDWLPYPGSNRGGHHGIEKLARAFRPGRVSFLRLESIAVADVDRAVGAPFPAAVINVEVMAMAVMMMPVMMVMMTMAMMTTVVPVMAVASVAAMPTMTMTSSEGLARDGQRSGGQRQSSDRGRNDLFDLRHGRLLGWAERGALCDNPPLEALAAMRCDQGHSPQFGMTRAVRYLPDARRDYLLNSRPGRTPGAMPEAITCPSANSSSSASSARPSRCG
jgi:hypothetical protein